MATTTYQNIPPEFDLDYHKIATSGDRYIYPRVRIKKLFTSRKRKKGLTQKSLMVILKPVWDAFTILQRDAWNAAGLVCRLSGWKLFVKDTAARMANDIPGYGTPNIYHQCFVGRLHVQSPATGMSIAQLHPLGYYVMKKVRGTRSQYEPVFVFEQFSLPLQIGLTFKTNLTSLGADWRARFYCVVESSYQGRDIETVCEIPFGLTDDWALHTATISSVVGTVRGYTAFIELHNVRGDLWIDNFDIIHNGINWARDPECNDINQGFTKAFYQIAKHWIAVNVTAGCYFESEYYT